MRSISRLLIVLLVCLVGIALPAAPAQAAGPIISLTPYSGVPGDQLTVNGENFTVDKYVDVYYDANGNGRLEDEEWMGDVVTDEDGNFHLSFVIPESERGVHVVFAEDQEGKSAADDFTVEPGLRVSPEEGPVGTSVTVKGRGFAEDEQDIALRYYLDGNYATIRANIGANVTGSWDWSFQVPSSSQGTHRIDAVGEISTEVEDATFEVTAGISLGKSSGIVGENITVTGSGFAADETDIKIFFAGEAVVTEISADDAGYWQQGFEVPEMPAGNYSVTAEGDVTSEEAVGTLTFRIDPDIVLSPDSGHVGTDLTVTGQGFAADRDVNIMYDGSLKAAVPTDAKGSFEASFIVPASEHGGRQVTARDVTGNNAAAIFTMESVPPAVPQPIAPTDKSRVGFIGGVRPTFAWSAVSDASGVSYSLQIATSASVGANGFADPVFTVTGLVGTNYTLGKADALPYGTYYWIVQAVDGAENGSAWTATRSFHAGFLPLWAFIVIIVAAVLLISGLVYFLVIRKRRLYY